MVQVKGSNQFGQLGNDNPSGTFNFYIVFFNGKNNLSETMDEITDITVDSVQELLDSIGSNRKILLKPGVYNLSEISSTGDNNHYVSVENEGVTIQNVSNLTIEGLGDCYVELVVNDLYVLILNFLNVDYIKIKNIRVGHVTNGNKCENGVILFQNSRNIAIMDSELYGCGSFGLGLGNSKDAIFEHLVISQCSLYDWHTADMFQLYLTQRSLQL